MLCFKNNYFYHINQVTMDLRDSGGNDFSLSDRYNSERIADGIQTDVSRREVQFRGFSQQTSKSPLYWSLPPQFLGNKVRKIQFWYPKQSQCMGYKKLM